MSQAFQRYFSKIDWTKIFDDLMSKCISLIFVFLLFFIAKKVIHSLVKRILTPSFKYTVQDEARKNTILRLVESLLNYCLYFILIYWILSIRSRELQFGIFRAMGLSMQEIITMLIGEQLLISGSSILIGIATGILATRLYLPLIQIAYSAADQVLPIEMISNYSDAVRLFTVIAVMIVCCMVILAWLISKIRIAQALKLGED